MFGIGALEFFLIAVVALLVIGPKDMPRALYHLGRLIRKFRSFTAEIQDGIDRATEDVALEEIAKEANKAGDEMTEFRIEQQKAIEERDKKEKSAKKKKKAPAKKKAVSKKKTTGKKKAVSKKRLDLHDG